MTDTLFADVSYFQRKVDDSYPYRVLSIRSNDGTFRDPNFAHNLDWCKRAVDSGRLEFFIVYCYWRANWEQTANVLIDMVGEPHPKMVVMIDLESGGNPGGDQSDGVNRMYWKFTDWLGNEERVIGYANSGDFRSMWQMRPEHLDMIFAGYGSDPNGPREIAHQYTDGQGYGHGLPEGCPPFGNCDMNSANGLSPQEFANVVGVGSTPPATEDDTMQQITSLVDGSTMTPEQTLGYIDFHSYNADENSKKLVALLTEQNQLLGKLITKLGG